MIRIDDPIDILNGVGPKKKNIFEKIGIKKIYDLLTYFPRNYKDKSKLKLMSNLINGETTTIKAKVCGPIEELKIRKKLTIIKVPITDYSANGYAVFFNSPYFKKVFTKDTEFYFYGKVKISSYNIEIEHPEYHLVRNSEKNTLGIEPIYKLTKGLSQKYIINLQKQILSQDSFNIDESLPKEILNKNRICSIDFAFKNIHFPKSIKALKVAKYRLVFEEFFFLQLGLLFIKKRYIFSKDGIEFKDDERIYKLVDSLPFHLTNAQRKAIEEIIGDMKSGKVMNRLLQGDVGSGKTIIALISMYFCHLNGYQSCLMAPTEILAEQHFKTFKSFLNEFDVEIGLLTSSVKNKKNIINSLKQGKINIVIGTHALIQDNIEFNNLGLVITDEQHRFGVRQRSFLNQKGKNPDVLVMTATPIPRTLSLMIFGDLDISIIDELPPGRKLIKTKHISVKETSKLYNFIKSEIKKGRQAYLVCPLIEESEQINAQSAVNLFEKLQKTYFKSYRLGLVHGKLKSEEKDLLMKKFKEKEIDILISTTVIEVGINVPNATIMVIYNAERFGLAQLHQLRGRVGRGEHQSYCFLITDNQGKTTKERMKVMESTNNGFLIAEKDLELRGPGDFFGTKQHGLPDLKIANFFSHVKILKEAQKEAIDVFKNFNKLSSDERKKIIMKMNNQFGNVFSNFSI